MSRPRLLPWLLVATLVFATLPAVSPQTVNQPPTVEIETPAEGSTVNGTTTVAGNASDDDGDVQSVEVRIDDGPWTNASGTNDWTFDWDTTQHADGEHTISARSYDGENHSQVRTRNVTVQNGGNGSSDGQAPSVTIDEPAEGAEVSGTTDVLGTASDADGNVTDVRVRIDDGPWVQADGTDSWSFSWDTTQHADGGHTVTVEAVDDGNKTATAQRNVTVANGGSGGGGSGSGGGQAPTVSIDDPSDGTTVNGTVLVAGTASDPDGNLSEVKARVDDGFWSPANGTAEWSFSWDTTSVEDGDHTITVQAVDDGGMTTNATLNVTVENGDQNGQPTVEITQPKPNATVNGTIEILGNASDPDGSIEGVEVRIGHSAWRSAQGTESWGLRWDVSDLDAGNHTLHVRVFDDDDIQADATRSIRVEADEQLSPTAADDLALTLSSPEDGETVEDELEIAGEVEGVDTNNTPIRVSYRIDDGSSRMIEVPGGGSFEETVNVSGLSPGEHELTVEAVHGDQSSDTRSKTFEVEEAGGQDVSSPQVGVALLVIGVLALGGLLLWARR